jgi:RNA polymerase sigma factor FliA
MVTRVDARGTIRRLRFVRAGGKCHVVTTDRDRLIVENLPLVGYLVNELIARATHLSRDDMASAGALALVQSADAFDPSLGVPFGAFARRRILGAFSDEMRSADWATRGARKRIKETMAVRETLTASLGRTPSVEELADALGVDRGTASEALQDASRVVTTLDETVSDSLVSTFVSPEDSMVGAERSAVIGSAVAALPDRMRYIVEEIYLRERTVKELADELGMTHSAVSQQRSEAIRLLRDGLMTHYADGAARTEDELESRIAPARRSAYLARVGEYVQSGLVRQLTDVGGASAVAAAS